MIRNPLVDDMFSRIAISLSIMQRWKSFYLRRPSGLGVCTRARACTNLGACRRFCACAQASPTFALLFFSTDPLSLGSTELLILVQPSSHSSLLAESAISRIEAIVAVLNIDMFACSLVVFRSPPFVLHTRRSTAPRPLPCAYWLAFIPLVLCCCLLEAE